MSGQVLEVDDLTVTFGSTVVLDALRLRVARGEAVGVVGASGCGKSTLLRAALGMLPAAADQHGVIRLAGRELGAASEAEWAAVRGRLVTIVPQGAMNSLDPVQRVGAQLVETIRVITGARRKDAATRARELLAEVGLPAGVDRRYPHQLSGGMAQRVLIAMALIGEPALILADEPTTGLDTLVQGEILALLARVRVERDVALVVVSHDRRALDLLCDRVEHLEDGRLVPATAVSVGHVPVITLVHAAHPPSTDPGHALTMTGVSVTYRGGARAAVDVDLQLGVGEVLALVGPSGSGKSTLARVALGLLAPTTGTAHVHGTDLHTCSSRTRRLTQHRIGFVHQDPYGALHPAMRIRELVAEPLVVAGVPRTEHAERVSTALRDSGLEPDATLLERHPGTLSGGQRQRVAIARAVVNDPVLTVADEPTSMLDAAHRRTAGDTLRTAALARGGGLLLITHDLREAARLADRIAVMHDGRILECGIAAELVARPTHPHTERLLKAAGMTPEGRFHR